MGILRILLGLVMLQGWAWATGVTLNFTNSGAQNNLKSDLTPLGADTFVEIGAFTPGFTPTALNRASWAVNWTALKRVRFDAVFGFFDGAANLLNNNSPFLTTNNVWVWVYDGSGQWCVYGRDTWKWPDANSFFPPTGIGYTPSQANIAVAGSVSSTTPRLVCEQVTDAASPSVSYADWATLWGLPAGSAGKAQDADKDGRSNLYEYALGGLPLDARQDSSVVSILPYSGQPHLAAKISRGWVTGVTYTVQWSENLTNWFTTGLTTVANTPPLLEVRDADPVGTADRRFLRVLVSSPD